MTATAKSVHPDESPDADAPETDSSQSKAARLADYLRERAEAGDMSCQSKFIADDRGIPAREIGARLVHPQ